MLSLAASAVLLSSGMARESSGPPAAAASGGDTSRSLAYWAGQGQVTGAGALSEFRLADYLEVTWAS